MRTPAKSAERLPLRRAHAKYGWAGLIGAVLLSGCGSVRPGYISAAPSAPPPQGAAVQAHRSYGHVRIDPPPPGRQPRFAAAQARASCTEADTSGRDKCTPDSEEELALFSDDDYGPADLHQPRKYQNVLVWLFTMHNIDCSRGLGGAPPLHGAVKPIVTPDYRCDQLFVVDADSGAELEISGFSAVRD